MRFTREVFVSAPDQVTVVRLAAVGADIRRWILEVPLPAELERAVREGWR